MGYSPKPEPPAVFLASAVRSNGLLNNVAILSAGMPIPVSFTSIRTLFSSLFVIFIATFPLGVYFTALSIILNIAAFNFSLSTKIKIPDPFVSLSTFYLKFKTRVFLFILQ